MRPRACKRAQQGGHTRTHAVRTLPLVLVACATGMHACSTTWCGRAYACASAAYKHARAHSACTQARGAHAFTWRWVKQQSTGTLGWVVRGSASVRMRRHAGVRACLQPAQGTTRCSWLRCGSCSWAGRQPHTACVCRGVCARLKARTWLPAGGAEATGTWG